MITPYVGYYTASLLGGDNFGSGFMTFTVDAAGKVKMGGKPADGVAVAQSGVLVIDGHGTVGAYFYGAPFSYKKNGGFEATCVFTKNAAGQVTVGGKAGWYFHNPVTDEGFDRNLTIEGGSYDTCINLRVFCENGLTVDEMKLPGLTAMVKHTDWNEDGTGKTTWSEPRQFAPVLEASPAGGALSLNAAGTGFTTPKADLPTKDVETGEYAYGEDTNGDGALNTSRLTFKLTRATGLFRGSFQVWFDYESVLDNTTETSKYAHTSRAVAFQGVLTPVREDTSDGIAGRGYFLGPDKVESPATNQPCSTQRSFDFKIRFPTLNTP